MVNNLNLSNRRNDLDIAKGIGIILVVWAHAEAPGSSFIYYFHMPLFFFISGMLFVPNKKTPKEYITGKMKSLLFPFWVWNLILYPVYFILYFWGQWDISTFLVDIAEILLTVDKVPFLGATWFLPALFWISVLFMLCHLLANKLKIKSFWIIIPIFTLLAVFGFNITLPYRISRTLILGLFYMLGFYYAKLEKKGTSFLIWQGLIAIFCAIGSVYCLRNNHVSLSDNVFDSKMLFIIGALMLIYIVLYVSKLIDTLRIDRLLAYLGRNSIGIVIWQFLAFRFAIILQIIIYKGSISWLVAWPVYDVSGVWWAIYIVAGIFGSILINRILYHNPVKSRLDSALKRRKECKNNG